MSSSLMIRIPKPIRNKTNSSFDDIKICRFLSSLVLLVFFANLVDVFVELSHNSIPPYVFSYLFKLVCAIFLIQSIPSIIRAFNTYILLFCCSLFLLAIVSFVFFYNVQLSDTFSTFFSMCITGCLAIASLDDYALLKQYYLFVSRIIALISLILVILSLFKKIESLNDSVYSMGLGYACVLPLMILFWNAVEAKSVVDFVGGIALFAILLIYGSRGPLVSILLFFVYYLLRYLFDNKKYLSVLTLTIAILFGLSYFNSILESLNSFLNANGFYSRTVYLLINDSVHDSGRYAIWKIVFNEIKENPFEIRGINADYQLIGMYSHNIVLELIYEFGIIIGSGLLIIIAFNCIKTILNSNNSSYSILCTILLFASLPGLFFSGSVWVNIIFWIWIGSIFLHNKEHYNGI